MFTILGAAQDGFVRGEVPSLPILVLLFNYSNSSQACLPYGVEHQDFWLLQQVSALMPTAEP